MARRWLIVAPVCLALAFTCTVTAQRRLDSMHGRTAGEELLYLPNEHLLTHFTARMSSVIADVLWIQCLQYTAKHFRGDHQFTWLNHMCTMITRLDPYFVPAYRYGGIFLAMLKADDSACIDLLERGMVRNPDAWELPYEVAMTYLLNRPDHPDSAIHAARYLAMAVETGKAPQFVVDLAANLQAQHDLTEVERAMWENTRHSEDQLMRDLAERKLQELALRETCAQLDKAIAFYTARRGRAPAALDDLVAGGVLPALPVDPLGGTYFMDATGRAQNTTILDERTARALNGIRGGVRAFEKRHGRLPSELRELLTGQIMPEIPRHPYADRTWQYDPSNGEVTEHIKNP